eukprot:Hpha_TRINITY_DN13475_c0_g2::TRINITY_DN13475_c0_g2_i1::g.131359::m.131359/K01110/PTEN; phosphatidylinositol-3,4,5-trisphosphate 3-phosphatase and dual-specificity protein phosphatase PTEN
MPPAEDAIGSPETLLWEGRLEKRAGGAKAALNDWASRWFQFRGPWLLYFEEKGRIDLSPGCKVSVRSEDGETGFLLEAKGKRPLQLRAPTPTDREQWVKILNSPPQHVIGSDRTKVLELEETSARAGLTAEAASSLSEIATGRLSQIARLAAMQESELRTVNRELEAREAQYEEQIDELRTEVDELRNEVDDVRKWNKVNGLNPLLHRVAVRALKTSPSTHQELLKCLKDQIEVESNEAPGGALASIVRGWVSMNKMRFQEDGFDLDLTYITPNVLAMGFPSHGTEGLFRNPVDQVERFFDQRHRNHFRIYNLCSERIYDRETRFQGNFRRFPFDDHNAPAPIQIVYQFIEDAGTFLRAHEKNVIGVHCKAGKGRTGVMICVYLMAIGYWKNTDEALKVFATTRTNDGVGVSIPSQQRYVRYYERTLRELGGKPPPAPRLNLKRLCVRGGNKPGSSSPWDLYVKVMVTAATRGAWEVFDSRKHPGSLTKKKADVFEFDLGSLTVEGDVRVAFYGARRFRGDEHMFHFWVHTYFVEPGKVVSLSKAEIDKAVKDTKNEHFHADLQLEAHFASVPQPKSDSKSPADAKPAKPAGRTSPEKSPKDKEMGAI